MSGRVRRKQLLAQAERLQAAKPGPECCALCRRPLGERTEWHHVVPKSRGGTHTVAFHPICHRIIHATLSNADLARDGFDLAALRRHPDIARFLDWIADKPPDFHAPTRRKR